MASGTPPGNWSAKTMLERFRMLTTPLDSFIWELTIEVGDENLGMAFVTAPGALSNLTGRLSCGSRPHTHHRGHGGIRWIVSSLGPLTGCIWSSP